jgi:hypothetical protein
MLKTRNNSRLRRRGNCFQRYVNAHIYWLAQGVGRDSPRRGFRPTILAMAGPSCLSVRARPVFIILIWGMQGHSAGSQIAEAGGLRHHHWTSIRVFALSCVCCSREVKCRPGEHVTANAVLDGSFCPIAYLPWSKEGTLLLFANWFLPSPKSGVGWTKVVEIDRLLGAQ